MIRKHFANFAALERQMNAARQLRAQTLRAQISAAFARCRPDPPPIASDHNASASPGMMADLHRSTGAAPALTRGLEPGSD